MQNLLKSLPWANTFGLSVWNAFFCTKAFCFIGLWNSIEFLKAYTIEGYNDCVRVASSDLRFCFEKINK